MTFRSIKAIPLIGIEPKAIKTSPPAFGWADPLKLRVEDEYQRNLTKRSIALIRDIAETFSWLHIKPPVCARDKNGNLCVIDGQHTFKASAELRIYKAQAHPAGTAEQIYEPVCHSGTPNRFRFALS